MTQRLATLRRALHLGTSYCLWFGMSAWAAEWPQIAMPPHVTAFAIGEQFSANGLPLRVQGFVTKEHSMATLVQWFRRSLGQPLVESKLGNKVILGRAEDGYYLSVQLEPLGPDGQAGSKGLLAVSDIATLQRNRETDANNAQRWLDRWPSGTRILSRMSSEDHGKTSLHIALSNGHSESLNREALLSVMQQDGLTLTHESSPKNGSDKPIPEALRGAKLLVFKGWQKEAIATIARTPQGQTSVVLTTTTDLETYRQ